MQQCSCFDLGFDLGWCSTELRSICSRTSSFSATPSPEVEIYEHESRHTGEPDWPLSATWLLSDPVGANSCLARTQNVPISEPHDSVLLCRKGSEPGELARRVSVNTLNTQGDSNVAPSGPSVVRGGCWVISQRD